MDGLIALAYAKKLYNLAEGPQGPQGEPGAGAVGTVADAYSTSKTYAVGDYVIHDEEFYRCTTAITTAEAFNSAHWAKLVLTDEVSDLKSDLFEQVEKDFAMSDFTWESGYIDTSGNIVSHAAYKCTNRIKTVPGTTITFTNLRAPADFYPAIACYGGGVYNNSVSAKGNEYTSYKSGTFTVPNGIDEVAFVTYYNAVNYNVNVSMTVVESVVARLSSEMGAVNNISQNVGSQWLGKKCVAFGTSITDTSYINTETGEVTGKYIPFLRDLSGLDITNRGIAGGTLASGGIHGGSHNILDAILNSNDLDDFDLITLEGFVNDFACAISIGDIGDTVYTTFCGALHQAISYCLENSHAEVVLITETTGKVYEMSGGSIADYTILRKNSLDLYQQAYNDAMIRTGQYYGVHVIDAGGKSQINQYHPEYIIDQIHHTTLGGEQYAKTIWEELKDITPAKVNS